MSKKGPSAALRKRRSRKTPVNRVEGKTEETFQAPVPDFGEKPGTNPGLFSWLDDCQALQEKEKRSLAVGSKTIGGLRL